MPSRSRTTLDALCGAVNPPSTNRHARSHRARILVAAAAMWLGAARVARGQDPTDRSPYPMNDSPITLRSGTVVRLRNVVVLRAAEGSGLHGGSMTLYIETPTPAADSTAVANQARELADAQIGSADQMEISTVTIGVCRTRACLEMREAPAELFRFRRGEDGQWRREADPRS